MVKLHITETSQKSGVAAEKAKKVEFSKHESIRKDLHMIPIAIENFSTF